MKKEGEKIMFNFANNLVERLVNKSASARLTDEEFILREINRFKGSNKRKLMVDGERYFDGDHDIIHRHRTVIGVDGELEIVKNLPNNRIVDNQYKKMVNQKNNYLLGQPVTIQCDNEQYEGILKQYFNRRFLRTIRMIGEDSLNCGIAYLFVYYNKDGQLTFKRFDPTEIIVGWEDAEHTTISYFIRVYKTLVYEGKQEKVVEKVEVYDDKGITFFELQNHTLKPEGHESYFMVGNDAFNWTRIPLIPFKYNAKEIPLIKMIKSLQDGLNIIESNFQNNMEEDARNTIMVLVNYDGQNLGEFRHNLATYGAVKVRSADGANGDVRTLQVEVNAENYKAIIELFKKAIIENAMGYDAKDDRMAGTPNQMNIQSMYNDIDLDANGMETEYQASFEDLLWFINCHLANTGQGDFENEEVEVIFNRDMLLNEGEVISNIQASVGILSDETLIAQHPWVTDVNAELERVQKQKEENLEQYGGAFMQGDGGDDVDE